MLTLDVLDNRYTIYFHNRNFLNCAAEKNVKELEKLQSQIEKVTIFCLNFSYIFNDEFLVQWKRSFMGGGGGHEPEREDNDRKY
jgi:hypothetical protein